MRYRIDRSPIDGSFGFTDVDNRFRPLIFNSAPMTEEGPVWFFEAVHDLGIGLFVVEFKSSPSRKAFHYYDSDLTFLTNKQSDLSRPYQAALYYAVQELDMNVLTLLKEPAGAVSAISDTALRIPSDLRITLAREFGGGPLPVKHIVMTASDNLSIGKPVDQSRLQDLFSIDFFRVQADAFRHGDLILPSIHDGSPTVSQGGVFLYYNKMTASYAYRFKCASTGLVYFVICVDNSRTSHSDWCYTIHGIAIPSMSVLIYKNLDAKEYCDYFFRVSIEDCFYNEMIRFGDVIKFSNRDRKVAPVPCVYFNHLGHHIWNELSGLDLLCRGQAPDCDVSEIFVVSPEKTEIYGALDVIFPAFKNINRSIDSFDSLREHFYRSNYLFLHLTDRRISVGLAERIMDESRRSCASHLPAIHDQAINLGFKVVVLGLRVENRTLTNLADFCRSVIKTLSANFKVAIVVDGHNRNGDDPRHSFGSLHSADPSVLEVAEKEVFDCLVDEFADDPSVMLISTLQRPMADSIFWCSKADLFVSPWGAGLAKYKWVGNLPGVIVSSRSFLSNPESILYDLPSYRENALVSRRIEPFESTDRPDAPCLIPVQGSILHVNYDVENQAVAREILLLAEELGLLKEPALIEHS